MSLLDGLPSKATVYEVGPRDGLQNEPVTVATPDKLRLIGALVDAGLKRIEVSSFVAARWIPQLADAEVVVASLKKTHPTLKLSALVPNMRGLERALGAGIDEVCVFLSVTESHSRKNINKTVAEAIATAREVSEAANKANKPVRAYVSTVWGCPFEGVVPLDRVVTVVKQISDIGFSELSLGDTIGVGTPKQTEAILGAVSKIVPKEMVALHLHDTRGTALANALVGLSMGYTTFDASIGGLGGCPYAPGAAGNLATEDLLYMLDGLGVATGVDLAKLVAAGALAQELIGRKLSGKYLQAALGEREKKSSARAET